MANESFVTENTLTDIPQEVLDEATNFYEDKNVTTPLDSVKQDLNPPAKTTATFVIEKTDTGQPLLTVLNGNNNEQNTLFTSLANMFNASTPGSYKQILESISRNQSAANLNTLIPSDELAKVTDFYVSKNVTTPWSATTQGLNPPTGTFDAVYYAKQNPNVLTQWSNAAKDVIFGDNTLPDVDITKRYDENTFLHQHYSTTGKTSGLRGNAAEEAASAGTYEETRQGLTDAEKQAFRDTVLGIGSNVGNAPIDATIEQIVNQENQNKFNYLLQDVLKNTVAEINKARQQEHKYDFYAGMPGFDEIKNFKSTLSNSLLGDSGIGGYLAMAGQGEAVKKLEKGVQSLLGTKDSVSYNWQKWFDESLASKYENLTQIANPKDVKKTYEIDKKFAKAFVNDYLKPRFNNSKSMSEFISYMDVQEGEQNVLQTQTVSNKLKELGMQKADSFLGKLATQSKGYFDSSFYFDPTGNKKKTDLYTTQKADVASAWDQAKNKSNALVNGMTWNQWAYKYGLDVNNKDQFAKLHYEVVGKPSGFDPSSDKPTNTDLFNYIDNELTPYLATAKEGFGDSVFLKFVTPDQLADRLVSSIDPLKTPKAWEETLKKYGIDGKNKSTEEVKELILTATRTAPAEATRSAIKSLNEKRETPTQKNLGIEYIQRNVDDISKPTGKETKLYSLFKSSGYGGTEDEFYKDFMPDVDRSDQQMISDALKGKNNKTTFNIDKANSFSTVNSIESLFSNVDSMESLFSDSKKQPSKDTQKSSYFTLFGDAEKKAEENSSSPCSAFNF